MTFQWISRSISKPPRICVGPDERDKRNSDDYFTHTSCPKKQSNKHGTSEKNDSTGGTSCFCASHPNDCFLDKIQNSFSNLYSGTTALHPKVSMYNPKQITYTAG